MAGKVVNDAKYLYMGDPSTQLAYPRGYAMIDSINGEPVDSVAGAPRSTPIVLKAMSRVAVSGTIRNAGNRIDSTFNGIVQLHVNDVSREQLIVNFIPGRNWAYTSTGGDDLPRREFRERRPLPCGLHGAQGYLVCRYDRPRASGGLLLRGRADGAGFTGLVRVGGTDTSAVNDGTGPAMHIYLNSRNSGRGMW